MPQGSRGHLAALLPSESALAEGGAYLRLQVCHGLRGVAPKQFWGLWHPGTLGRTVAPPLDHAAILGLQGWQRPRAFPDDQHRLAPRGR